MAKLIYDARNYDSSRTYENKGITFTKDGYIITHGIVYDATGIAKSLGSDIVSIANLSGGSEGTIVYQSDEGKTAYLAPGTNGQVLKYNTSKKAPEWTTDNNTTYKLTLNGTQNGSGSTDLGSFYAPTSAGTSGQILQSTAGTPGWVTLESTLGGTSTTAIPSSKAVKDAIDTATAGLTGAMHYVGTTTVTENGSTITVAAITGHTFASGDVVVSNASSTKKNAEYVYDGTNWRELGDEGSYLLKSSKPITSTGNGALSIGTGDIGSGISINLATITVTNTKGTNNIVNGVTTDSYGRVTAVSYATAELTDTWKANTASVEGYVAAPGANHAGYEIWGVGAAKSNPSWQSLWYASNTVVGGVKLNAAKPTSGNGVTLTTYGGDNSALKLDVNGIAYVTMPNIANLMGSTKIGDTNKGVYWTGSAWSANTYKVEKDVPSNAVFTDTNTWRPVNAWKLSQLANTNDSIDVIWEKDIPSTGTADLSFGPSFAYDDTNNVLDLVWCEVNEQGVISYSM